jgi:hypothetical protein
MNPSILDTLADNGLSAADTAFLDRLRARAKSGPTMQLTWDESARLTRICAERGIFLNGLAPPPSSGRHRQLWDEAVQRETERYQAEIKRGLS